MTLLYIEDDPDDQEIFREALSRVSLHSLLIIASNGIEALDILESNQYKFDYIFLDVNMPRMDGKKFLEELKARHLRDKPPVVVYTTSNNPKEAGALLALGAVQVLVKRHSFPEVCKVLKDFI